MAGQSIASILDDLNRAYAGTDSQSEAPVKTASAKDTPAVDAAQKDLTASLQNLLGNSGREKEASHQEGSATRQLEKMASDMASADLKATIKEAHVFGAAVFDGFMARANEYAGAEKTASTHNVAAYDNGHIKQAAAQGYAETSNVLGALAQTPVRQKTAAEESARGIIDALEKVAAFSEDCFLRGAAHAGALLDQQG